MKVRYAIKSDIPQIVMLCQAHAKFEKSPYSVKNKVKLLEKHLFSTTNDVKCLVVEKENILVGYATFMKQFSTWQARFYLYLDCLYLVERVRGNGVGYKIMCKIKEYAKEQNCSIMQWQTPVFNKTAIGFYKKLGATSKAKERFFWE